MGDERPPNYPPSYDEAIKPGASFTAPPIGSVDAARANPPLQPINQPPPQVGYSRTV